MCGIIGIISNYTSKRIVEMTISALERLEYRGYDSVGMAVVNNNGIEIKKMKGKVQEFLIRAKPHNMEGFATLGHTRWATHGVPADHNAHPHSDCKGKIIVVHNGTILNFKELKEELQALGHVFKSETDTEVIPHLIEEFLKRGFSPFDAFKMAIKSIRGSFALVAFIEGENRLFFSKRDNPLVLGFGENVNFVASDIPAFLPYTKKVAVVFDNEVGYITHNSVYIEDLFSGKVIDILRRIKVINWDIKTAQKGGYPHFMLKEIHESPNAVKETLNALKLQELSDLTNALKEAERIIVTASGTSFYAGLLFSILLQSEGYTVIPIIASEYYTLRAKRGDIVVAISQSGETMDVLMAVRKFKSDGAEIISLTNVMDSSISRESNYKVYMNAGPEIAVAATKTFTCEVVSLMYLYEILRGGNCDYLFKSPDILSKAITTVEGYVKDLSLSISKAKSMYYLGRGKGFPLALEGALKMKEIAYIHAEAYPAGESKHGPIALVEKDYPVIFINVGENSELLQNNLQEMKARGARTISISVNKRLGADEEIIINLDDERLGVISAIPFVQLLAYYTSVFKGNDPDRPRNLAKTVTVE